MEKHESKEQFLYDLDKSKTLCEIVRDICKKAGLPESPVYGLKLIQTKENPFINTYISENTYKDIQHSDCLKIVFSIEYLLNQRILPHIDHPDESLEKTISFEDLLKLSVDPIFIEKLVQSETHKYLINVFIENQLKENEVLPLLITICHLFQKGHIADTSQNILNKTISIIKDSNNSIEQLKYALSILHKILVQKNQVFVPWKEKIIKEVPITDLTPYIWNENNRSLQYGILLLINTIIKLCKGVKKQQLIKEMNLKQNRDSIYRYIIVPGGLEKNTEHELYVLQTYLLSMYKEALDNEININDSNLFQREEFELCEEDVKRLTVLMDFDENNMNYPISYASMENINCSQSERISLASILSDKSYTSSRKSSVTGSRSDIAYDYDNYRISYLTLEALRHYKKHHYKVFYQSQVEEKVYEPGIFVTSQRIVKMLAKILHLGMEPDNRSIFYQPIVFNCSSRTPFFLELFSRAMWLLSRTRREMKVSTIDDYPKVMNALEKQIKMVLEKRPIDFKALTNEMTDITFDVVMQRWKDERADELKILLKTHPCIQQMKTDFGKQNEEHIYNNRINFLKRGAHFPKVLEKKTSGNMFVQLSKNERELHIYDIKSVKTNEMDLLEKIKICDITHVVIGKNCKHSNLCKSAQQAFSIIVNHLENQVNFIAKDERTACYWTDAFNLLIGSTKRSDFYQRELDELVEMDVMLQILELQNIRIPRHAPPVPPLPSETKPPIPPKPDTETFIRMTKRKNHR
ncbi:engulfment and cell motility protein 1 isoform X2 [Anoplophora glabripennis]|uniref:engulfment and cell motility protein 1 isoform X2 n=1 Tax=Anoplophora glabripennis TaxID=217634 RepID=UPI000874250A|nr:engulfment and cell motility protein 1 isoform X2 [Anoplophora glabripennis]